MGDHAGGFHLAQRGIALDVVQRAEKIGNQHPVGRLSAQSGHIPFNIRRAVGQRIRKFAQCLMVMYFRVDQCLNVRHIVAPFSWQQAKSSKFVGSIALRRHRLNPFASRGAIAWTGWPKNVMLRASQMRSQLFAAQSMVSEA